MDDDLEELDREVLSYPAFRNRQLLRAWQERRRIYQAHQSRKGKLKDDDLRLPESSRRDTTAAS